MKWLSFIPQRYLWLGLAGVIIATHIWTAHWFYTAGKKLAKTEVIEKVIEVDRKSRNESAKVTQHVQSLEERHIDDELCKLSIVRERSGCK